MVDYELFKRTVEIVSSMVQGAVANGKKTNVKELLDETYYALLELKNKSDDDLRNGR